MPQGLDQRSKLEDVGTKMACRRGSSMRDSPKGVELDPAVDDHNSLLTAPASRCLIVVVQSPLSLTNSSRGPNIWSPPNRLEPFKVALRFEWSWALCVFLTFYCFWMLMFMRSQETAQHSNQLQTNLKMY